MTELKGTLKEAQDVFDSIFRNQLVDTKGRTVGFRCEHESLVKMFQFLDKPLTDGYHTFEELYEVFRKITVVLDEEYYEVAHSMIHKICGDVLDKLATKGNDCGI